MIQQFATFLFAMSKVRAMLQLDMPKFLVAPEFVLQRQDQVRQT
jgi:hypothetical protein